MKVNPTQTSLKLKKSLKLLLVSEVISQSNIYTVLSVHSKLHPGFQSTKQRHSGDTQLDGFYKCVYLKP